MRLSLIALMIMLATTLVAADPGEAERLRQEGLQAAKEKNWEVARARYEASYAIDGRPLTLYNVAVAQEQTDRLREAKASYAKFLEVTKEGESPQFRKAAQAALPRIDASIPTLQIRVSGFPAGTSVTVDDKPILAADLAAPIQLNPGDHVVVLSRDKTELGRRAITMQRNMRSDVELVAPAAPVALPEPSTKPHPSVEPTKPAPVARSGSKSILSSGWFWGIAGVVVLGAAGGAYYVASDSGPAATPGTLVPGVVVIR